MMLTHAQAYTYQTVKLESSGTNLESATIVLWDAGSIVSSNRQHHRDRLSAAVEDLAKQFVTAWNLDNKDHSGALTFDEFAPKAQKGLFDDLIPKKGKGEYDDLIPKKGKGEYDDIPFGFARGPAAAVPPGVKPVTATDLPKPPLDAASNPAAFSTLADSNAPKPDAKTERKLSPSNIAAR